MSYSDCITVYDNIFSLFEAHTVKTIKPYTPKIPWVFPAPEITHPLEACLVSGFQTGRASRCRPHLVLQHVRSNLDNSHKIYIHPSLACKTFRFLQELSPPWFYLLKLNSIFTYILKSSVSICLTQAEERAS